MQIAKGDNDTFRALCNRVHNVEMVFPCYPSTPSEEELVRVRRSLNLPHDQNPRYYLLFEPKRFEGKDEIINLEDHGGIALFNLMLLSPSFNEDSQNYPVFHDGDALQKPKVASKYHIPLSSDH